MFQQVPEKRARGRLGAVSISEDEQERRSARRTQDLQHERGAVDVAPLHVVHVNDDRPAARQVRQERAERDERPLLHDLWIVDGGGGQPTDRLHPTQDREQTRDRPRVRRQHDLVAVQLEGDQVPAERIDDPVDRLVSDGLPLVGATPQRHAPLRARPGRRGSASRAPTCRSPRGPSRAPSPCRRRGRSRSVSCKARSSRSRPTRSGPLWGKAAGGGLGCLLWAAAEPAQAPSVPSSGLRARAAGGRDTGRRGPRGRRRRAPSAPEDRGPTCDSEHRSPRRRTAACRRAPRRARLRRCTSRWPASAARGGPARAPCTRGCRRDAIQATAHRPRATTPPRHRSPRARRAHRLRPGRSTA